MIVPCARLVVSLRVVLTLRPPVKSADTKAAATMLARIWTKNRRTPRTTLIDPMSTIPTVTAGSYAC